MALPEIIKDIDARVKKSGDTMTGKLYTTSNLNGSLACANTNGAFRIDGGTDYQTGAFLALNGVNSTYYPNAFQLVASDGVARKELFGNTDGTLTWDNNIILHTGNKNLITADDISASRAHKDSWDFTQQHHSNEVTFDMKNAPGAPPGGWVNGFVSTHNNYLSSYIVNTHRTNNWYVGYGETVGISPTWYKLLHSGNYSEYALPLSGGTINGNITVNGNVWYKGLRMQSYEITVNGDLNTYYPVAVDSSFSGNTEAIIITVSKTLNTTSPAWPGNHNGGTSSLMASYLVRNNGWDGNGNFVYSITPPQQQYAQVLSHVELRQSAAHHLVFWLRGGGATYRIAANIPTTINVYLSETNLGNSSYPNNVSPRTDIGNAGWIFESPTFLPIKGGTVDGTIRANNVYGAVWNDYAEYRKAESIEPGRVVVESPDGQMKLSTERLQPGAEIISDTFGFAIGETDEYKTPIAATGRVLAYSNEDRYSYPLGCAVCSGPNGTVSQMTREEIREYPERIIGTVSEIPEYKTWGTGNVEVNGRIWIRIK